MARIRRRPVSERHQANPDARWSRARGHDHFGWPPPPYDPRADPDGAIAAGWRLRTGWKPCPHRFGETCTRQPIRTPQGDRDAR